MSDSTDSTGDFDQAATGRTTLRYLARAMHADHPSDEPFVLNPAERHAIFRIGGITMLVSSALVVFGIWLFYLPHVFWANWFTETHTALGDWPLISILFAVLILYVVLHALLFIHTGAVRLIEMTCQFPRFHDSSYSRHMHQLAENSPRHSSFRLRTSPRPLLPWTLSFYLVTVLLLAFGTSVLFQVIFRVWGQQLVSPVVAILCTTLAVAVLVSLATYRVLQQAQIRVMAPLTIRQFTNELVEEFGRESTFRQLLPGLLQQAGVSPKPDNYPHLLLVESLKSRFSIDLTQLMASKVESVPEQLANCPDAVRQGLERLFIFSILIDGHLSARDRNRLAQFKDAGILTVSVADVESMRRNFVDGDGLWV